MTPHRREVPLPAPAAPDFTHFLSSELWIEPSGMALSVLSALARLNFDPWREALRLATIPRTAAALTLAKAMGGLPDRPIAVDIAATAARLVQLLPDVATGPAIRDGGETRRPRARWWAGACRRWKLWLILLLAACILYLRYFG